MQINKKKTAQKGIMARTKRVIKEEK